MQTTRALCFFNLVKGNGDPLENVTPDPGACLSLCFPGRVPDQWLLLAQRAELVQPPQECAAAGKAGL